MSHVHTPTNQQRYTQLSALPVFAKRMGELCEGVRATTREVLAAATGADSAAVGAYGRVADLADVGDAYDTAFEGVLDGLLDAVDTYADVASGQRQLPSLVVSRATVGESSDASSAAGAAAAAAKATSGVCLFYGKNVGRPQDTFEDRVDNDPERVWEPRLTEKPNAVVPLEAVRAEYERLKIARSRVDRTPDAALDDHAEELGGSRAIQRDAGDGDGTEGVLVLPNAYRAEIEGFAYLPWQLAAAPEVKYGPLADTPLTFVDSVAQLAAMEAKLEAAQMFAVDLEAHDYRSYAGFSCLMQISTRTEDFIVDSLALRAHMHLLNASFTNPRILKVFHGCDWDILWLQRDFGVYVVNCFDTGQAARVLHLGGFGLKFLLQQYCGVEVDKKYQLADWRIRPIPDEMLHYAREDTHYLLYIYDRMKTDLIARANGASDLVREVLDRTRRICEKPYAPPAPPTREDARRLILNPKVGPMDEDQVELVWQLCQWRDEVARVEDESTRFVLPNYMVVKIAEARPSSIPLLLACCSPVPPLVRIRAVDILGIVKRCCAAKNAEASAAERIAADIARAKGLSPPPKHNDAVPIQKPQPQKAEPQKRPAPREAAKPQGAAAATEHKEVVVPKPVTAVVTQAQTAAKSTLLSTGNVASIDDSDSEDDGVDTARMIASSFGAAATIAPEVTRLTPEEVQSALWKTGEKAEEPETKKQRTDQELDDANEEVKKEEEKEEENKGEDEEEMKDDQDEKKEADEDIADPDLAERPRLKQRNPAPTQFKTESYKPKKAAEKKTQFHAFDYSKLQQPSANFQMGAVNGQQQRKLQQQKEREQKKNPGEKLTIVQPSFGTNKQKGKPTMKLMESYTSRT